VLHSKRSRSSRSTPDTFLHPRLFLYQSEFVAMIQHMLSELPGPWQVSILGSQENDRWEMTINARILHVHRGADPVSPGVILCTGSIPHESNLPRHSGLLAESHPAFTMFRWIFDCSCRMTGKQEGISSSVGLVPANALASSNFRMVGNPEITP
jgi:hypothetical protein